MSDLRKGGGTAMPSRGLWAGAILHASIRSDWGDANILIQIFTYHAVANMTSACLCAYLNPARLRVLTLSARSPGVLAPCTGLSRRRRKQEWGGN